MAKKNLSRFDFLARLTRCVAQKAAQNVVVRFDKHGRRMTGCEQHIALLPFWFGKLNTQCASVLASCSVKKNQFCHT